MDHKIQQWEASQDGLENLNLCEAPMPEPKKDEVLVEIQTVSLNFRDTEVAMGVYGHHKGVKQPKTIVPCSDMCGIIIKIGEGSSTSWKVGDRVLSIFNQTHLSGTITSKDMMSGLGLPLPGVLTTHRIFPEYGLLKAPEYLTNEEACTLAIAAVTAWMSINGMRPLGQPGGSGETVLLQGTGGVSICGLQIAKASDATVIVTSSSNEKLEKARKLGADYITNYKENPDWQEEVMKITNDEGANIILEVGGARTLRKSFGCIAFGGLINCIGYLSGKEDEPGDRTNVNVLALRKNLTLKGILNGPRDRFEEMLQFYEKHEIHPVVDRVFPFQEAKGAFQYLYRGSHFGKVVIAVKASR